VGCMGWSGSRRVSPQEWRLLPLTVACIFVFGLHASHSHAQLYKWTDENGKVSYSDTVPPGANDRAHVELRRDGTVKAATERVATAEEKQLAAAKAVEAAKAREAQIERERKDKALLATYVDLNDFDRVRDRTLTTFENEIRALAEREAFLDKVLATPEGQPLPAAAAPVAAVGDKDAKGTAPKTAPAKAAPAKSTSARLLEAKAELPRITESLTRKRRDRADMTAQYASERVRLANLFDAERARLDSTKRTSALLMPVSPVKK